jgi:hypothetical protein
MPWDSTRPVPWRRLAIDWAIYIGIMFVALLIFARDQVDAGVFAGLLASGPLFLAIGAVLAKFGYQRKTLRELRGQSAAARQAKAATSATTQATPTARPKPAPTKRTSGGGGRSSRPQR